MSTVGEMGATSPRGDETECKDSKERGRVRDRESESPCALYPRQVPLEWLVPKGYLLVPLMIFLPSWPSVELDLPPIAKHTTAAV